MTADHLAEAGTSRNRYLLEATLGYLGFCALSSLSHFLPAALPLMVIAGLALPLVWGWQSGTWAVMGFTRRNLRRALRWGLAAGLATGLIGLLVVPERSLPPDLGLELAIGIPLWLLVASPFQEFFFRGWLQPRFERRLGRGLGLLVTTAAFTAWHYCWPLAAQTSVPLYSLAGFAATFGAGLIYGYSFQRTGNLVAPWLAHALSGIAFVVMGAGGFTAQMP